MGLVLRQRFSDIVRAYPFFFLRRKKNSEKERPLRGFRREVSPVLLRRTEMKSKPGLNAAPPPETPRGTGKPGEPNNRDVVHSGESFRVRVKAVRSAFPFEGKAVLFAAERLII